MNRTLLGVFAAVVAFTAAALSQEAPKSVTSAPAAQAPAPATTAAPTPAPDCRLKRRALLDITMDDTGRITVPVTVNGLAKDIMIDTGAESTMIAAELVRELKLPTKPAAIVMMGVGRVLGDRYVAIDEFGVGQMKGKNFKFFVLNDPMDSAGLLGPDFLSNFDNDFDFAAAKLRLFSPDHCPGKVMYWTRGSYGVVPFEIEANHIMVKVLLDGKEVKAAIDTGAADTVMSLDMASRAFDLNGDKLKRSRHYPFKTLSFGEVIVGNPAILLIPDEESGVMGHHSRDLQMIIGMGVLRRLHLYLSYKEKTIYVTPATQY